MDNCTLKMSPKKPAVLVSPVLSSIGRSSRTWNSIKDQAELLLSISDIAKSEITAYPLALEDIPPPFPSLGEVEEPVARSLAPRVEPLRNIMFPTLRSATMQPPPRLRSVSLDVSTKNVERNEESTCSIDQRQHRGSTSSPTPKLTVTPIVSPTRTPPRRTHFRSTRLSQKARRERSNHKESSFDQDELEDEEPDTTTPKEKLQDKPPKGVPITKIRRRKFSWKNYPEVRRYQYHASVRSLSSAFSVGRIFGSQPGRVPPPFCSQLHSPTKTVQQSSHSTTSRSGNCQWVPV